MALPAADRRPREIGCGVTSDSIYVTVAEAAERMERSERTIRRWMNARLLTVYRRSSDGLLVLDFAELTQVEREQRHRNPTRGRKRAETFAQVASMTYRRQ